MVVCKARAGLFTVSAGMPRFLEGRRPAGAFGDPRGQTGGRLLPWGAPGAATAINL